MKTRKILAIVLSTLMLLLPLSVGVFAEDEIITPITVTSLTNISMNVTAENFAITTSVEALPGGFEYFNGTGAFSAKINYVFVFNSFGEKIYYMNNTNSAEFFDVFSDGNDHIVYINYTASVDSSKAAGEVYVTITCTEPNADTASRKICHVIDSYYSTTLTSSPAITSYFCGDTFNPQGIAATVLMSSEHRTGASGTVVEYNDSTAADFSFSPALTQKLNTTNTFVEVSYKGEVLGTVDINVSHVPSADVVSFGKHNHGVNCSECGAVCSVEQHLFDATSWKVASDATFLTPETEVGTCIVCGETVTRTIYGTEGYLVTFANNPGILAVISAIATFLQVIKSL